MTLFELYWLATSDGRVPVGAVCVFHMELHICCATDSVILWRKKNKKKKTTKKQEMLQYVTNALEDPS